MIEKLANKTHIELRSPEFGVTVSDPLHSAVPIISVMLEVPAFEIGVEAFNGAVLQLSVSDAIRLSRNIERGIALVKKLEDDLAKGK